MLFSSCNAQTSEQVDSLERSFVVAIDKINRTYYKDEKLPFDPYYNGAAYKDIFEGYTSPYETIISWQQASTNQYKRAHYVFPEDASNMDFKEQIHRTNPANFERDFLSLDYSSSFVDKMINPYYVIITNEYRDSILQNEKKVFLLKKDAEQKYKIATRMDKDEWELIFFYTCIQENILIQLTKKKEQDLDSKYLESPLFMECYRRTRSIVNNGFVVAKMIDYIRELKDAGGNIIKIGFFYDFNFIFVDCNDPLTLYFSRKF